MEPVIQNNCEGKRGEVMGFGCVGESRAITTSDEDVKRQITHMTLYATVLCHLSCVTYCILLDMPVELL